MTGARALAAAAAFCCLAGAIDPNSALKDPAKEARARQLFRETRCLVCQGQSIDESDAPLAADLRQIIRTQVGKGLSDHQIRAFLVARYGDFALLRPPLSAANAVLWMSPFLVAALGAGVLIARARRSEATPPLSPAEEATLAKIRAGDES